MIGAAIEMRKPQTMTAMELSVLRRAGGIMPSQREPSGKKQRPTVAEIRRAEKDGKSVVLSQPHRNGSTDDRRHWAVGRLVLDKKVTHGRYDATQLERAAELYAKDYGDLRWVLDSRRPWWNSVGAGRAEPTPDERARIEAKWGDVNRVLRDCGERVKKAVQIATLDLHPDYDERIMAPWIILSLSEGLGALVHFYGLDTSH